MVPLIEQAYNPDILERYSKSLISVNELFGTLYKIVYDKPIRFIIPRPDTISIISASQKEEFVFEMAKYYSAKLTKREVKSSQALFSTVKDNIFATWFIGIDKSTVEEGDWTTMNGDRIIDPKWLHIGRYTVTDMATSITKPQPSANFRVEDWCTSQFDQNVKEIFPLDIH